MNKVQDVAEYAWIIKNGYYYRENYRGYTSSILEAGIYPAEDAHKHGAKCKEIKVVDVNAEQYNEMITDAIERLKSKIIKI